jgi:hypothetical protein
MRDESRQHIYIYIYRYLARLGQGLQLVIIGMPKDNMDVIND